MMNINTIKVSKEQMNAIVHLQYRGVKWDFLTIKTIEDDAITLTGKLDRDRIEATIKHDGSLNHKRYAV